MIFACPLLGGCSGSLLQRAGRRGCTCYCAHCTLPAQRGESMCSVGFPERKVTLRSSLEECVKGGRGRGGRQPCYVLLQSLQNAPARSARTATFLRLNCRYCLVFLQGECIWPSSTVGGIKKSCMTAPLPHSYLLYHGLQQLHWASTWHTCLVCANISVSPSSPLIYIATFIAAISLRFTCYN